MPIKLEQKENNMTTRDRLKQEILSRSPRYTEEDRKKLTVVLDGEYFELLERLCLISDNSKTNLLRIALDELADKIGRTQLYPISPPSPI